MWFRLSYHWVPVNILLISSFPSLLLPLLPGPAIGTTYFFSQFLHLYCSITPASQEGWQDFPEHPLTPHGPFLSEHKPCWTLIHRLLYIRTTSLSTHGMGHQNLPALASPSLEAYGACLTAPEHQCCHGSFHTLSSGPSHLATQNNNW